MSADPSPGADGKYPAATVVTLTANPNGAYSFSSWSGDASGSSNPTQVTMNGNRSVTANFSGGDNLAVTGLFITDESDRGGQDVPSPSEGQRVNLEAGITWSGVNPVNCAYVILLDGQAVSSGSIDWFTGRWSWGTWTATAGTHSFEWRLDTENVVQETNENDNILSRVFTVGDGSPKPDLCDRGESYRSFSPTTVYLNAPFEVHCDIRNAGASASGPFVVKFYASKYTSISAGDHYYLGEKPMNSIPARGYADCDWSDSFHSNEYVPDENYYVGWIIDQDNTVPESDETNNEARKEGYKLAFRNDGTRPIKAKNPNPPSGAVDQPTDVQLSWQNGGGATSYGVYFDGLFRGVQTETSYNPGMLAHSSTHSWRIDAQNAAGPTTGDSWSFTVISRIREFITLFYQKVLARDPESGAVDAWEQGYYNYALTFNIDVRFIGREMGRCFFLSQEYLMRNRTNADFITDCYRAFLGRDPNQWELSGWVNGVWTRGEAMTIFAESGEFANRMDLISTQRGDPTRNFVTTMYIGIFDRLVDSGGLAYWADVMAAAQSKRSKAKEMGLLLFDSAE
ncbi:MAG: DUF4214 domain-containing protein, partial [Armatimonadetes bacterium]|nr:DUF4214 domain-containing protein [Armatimonadota bacterium]